MKLLNLFKRKHKPKPIIQLELLDNGKLNVHIRVDVFPEELADQIANQLNDVIERGCEVLLGACEVDEQPKPEITE